MSARAKAAVLVAPRRIEIEDFPLPEIGGEDALLRVEATGVCGSDVAICCGELSGDLAPLPLVLGHEIVGRIERIGAAAAERWGVHEGDRIIVEEHIPCGRCELCYEGRHKLCIRRRYGALSTRESPGLWGGYAEFVYLHPNSVVYPVSPSVAPELVPLFIPVSNGIDWVERVGKAAIGCTVVIQGPGQHGLGCVIAARECGAGTIVVTGLSHDRRRLELARDLGATHVLEADRDDVVERVREITRGRMAEVVVDVTPGATEPVEMALDLARIGGTIVLAGMKHFRPVTNFLSDKMFFKELTMKGVWGRNREAVPAALRLIESGRYPLERLCTHTFPVEQTALALETAAREHGEEALHVSVVPTAGARATARIGVK